MMLPTVSADEMRAGQIMTGAAMAAFIAARFAPRHGRAIRAAVLTIYVTGIAAFIVWFLAR
jgi:hypothetical protein